MQRIIDTGLIVLLLTTLATPGTVISPAAIAQPGPSSSTLPLVP